MKSLSLLLCFAVGTVVHCGGAKCSAAEYKLRGAFIKLKKDRYRYCFVIRANRIGNRSLEIPSPTLRAQNNLY